VRQVGYLSELYEDARSGKYQKVRRRRQRLNENCNYKLVITCVWQPLK